MKNGQQAKLSIVIPVYNVGEYLDACMQSVLKQEYQILEIILVDDGSTDQSPELCDSYAQKDERFKVLHKKNQGVGAARNDGLHMATGDYIGFLDPDDWIEKDMFGKLIEALEKEDAQAAFCSFYRETPDGSMEREPAIPKGLTGDGQDAIAKCFDVGYGTMMWDKVFHRSLLQNDNEEFICIRTDLKCGEDQMWLMEVLKRAKKVVYVPEYLYHWRIRGGSAYRDEQITDKKVQDVVVQEMSLAFINKDNTVAYELAMGRLYAKAYEYMVLAYIQGEKTFFNELKIYSDRYKKDWWNAKDTTTLSKIKRTCIEFAIGLHLSRKLVAMVKKM